MTPYPILDEKDTRSGFGAGLLEAGQRDEAVVALCADLTGSLKMDGFAKAFPKRFFQMGVAEANMMGVAAGLTIGGRIPVNTSGGLLRKGHPVGATGIAQIVELTEQLADRSGPRQVDGARVGLAHNGGGTLGTDVAAMCVSVLST